MSELHIDLDHNIGDNVWVVVEQGKKSFVTFGEVSRTTVTIMLDRMNIQYEVIVRSSVETCRHTVPAKHVFGVKEKALDKYSELLTVKH